jgi:hypothetical protein
VDIAANLKVYTREAEYGQVMFQTVTVEGDRVTVT